VDVKGRRVPDTPFLRLRGGGQEEIGPNSGRAFNVILNSTQFMQDQIQWLNQHPEETDTGQNVRNPSYLRSRLPVGDIPAEQHEPDRSAPGTGLQPRELFQDLGVGRRQRQQFNVGEFHDAMVRQGQEQQAPTPIVLQTGQQRGLLQAPQVGQVVGKAKPQIVIKQTVKQIQQSKGRRRDKKVRFANKNVRSKLKKEYTQAKKQLHKELMTKKKLDYEKQNDIIKKLPAKQRKGARVKLRATLSKKMKALKSALLPLSRLKNPSDIEAAIKSLKKIKW
jgi:hypothetical protein